MKTANVADLRNRFSDISRWIEDGESVTITKRGRVFATLTPPQPAKKEIPEWPDRAARRKKAFPDGPVKDSAELFEYMRGNY